MLIPQFNFSTLNIFTDASIEQLPTGEYVSCSGAVAYTGTFEDTRIVEEVFQINRDSTNNNGEIIAIKKGIELAIKHKKEFDNFNLFSDSKICVYGLREWLRNWVRASKGNILIGSQNTPVMNQNEIITCINLILSNNLPIRLYHQKGHAKDKNLSVSLQTFKTSNFIEEKYIANQLLTLINSCNDYVDVTSRNTLIENISQKRDIYSKPISKPTQLIEYIYDPKMDLDYYMSLVKN